MVDRITFTPGVMGGQACVRGMRIPVSLVVKLVAQGLTNKEIIENYPDLEPEDLNACLNYAAMMTEDRILEVRKTG